LDIKTKRQTAILRMVQCRRQECFRENNKNTNVITSCKWTLHSRHKLAHSSFVIKPNKCTNFTNLFWHETLHVSDCSSVHHQEFIHCTLSNGIRHIGLQTSVYKPVWRITLLSVQWINSWWWTEELSETCRISCQNKLVKLVHLVRFIIKNFVMMHGHMKVKFGNQLYTWIILKF
jgi:hypothetical protein